MKKLQNRIFLFCSFVLIKLTVQIVLKMANSNVKFIHEKKKTGGSSVQIAGIDSKSSTPHLNRKNCQQIPPGTLNIFLRLLMITTWLR